MYPIALLMMSELGQMWSDYSWHPGPSGILTLNTHSNSAEMLSHTLTVGTFSLAFYHHESGSRETAVRAAAPSHSRTVRWMTDRTPKAWWRHNYRFLSFSKCRSWNATENQGNDKQLHERTLTLGCFFSVSMFSAFRKNWPLMEFNLQTILSLCSP